MTKPKDDFVAGLMRMAAAIQTMGLSAEFDMSVPLDVFVALSMDTGGLVCTSLTFYVGMGDIVTIRPRPTESYAPPKPWYFTRGQK